MKLKLFKKFFFTSSLIIFFSLAIMIVTLMVVFNNYIAKKNYDSLNECCVTLADLINKQAVYEDFLAKNIVDVMSTLSNVSDSEIFISDNNGVIKICSCEEWKQSGSCDNSKSVISSEYLNTINSEDDFWINTLGIYKKAHYVSAAAIYSKDNTQMGYVFATAPVSVVRMLMSTTLKLYIVSAIIPIGIMFIALYLMIYRLTKPLKLMSEASRAMAKGDFSRRIPVTSDDEIGELSIAFNQMTNSLVQLEGMRRSFVANVSHELKTPMTTIGGFIDGIIDGTIETEKQQYYLNIASKEVKRLTRLIQSMLSLSKLESGEFILKPELFDFCETLFSIVLSQEQRIEKLNLNITGLDAIPSVSLEADKDLVYQVIYNLVDNAIKFTDQGGSIDFKVKIEGRQLVFTIINTGKGINKEELPYVFERFYKADKSRSAKKDSTGLGLYIVKTIIKIHGGTIKVTSKENEFTAFEVALPLKK